MPGPVSVMQTLMNSLPGSPGSSVSVLIVMLPPSGVNYIELIIMFMKSCLMLPGSATIFGRSRLRSSTRL